MEGLRKYAFDEETRQLLLVGRPGSGKSTALARLLLEEATLTPNASLNIGRGELKAIPVLVELRYWQTTIEALMLEFFHRHGLNLSAAELKNLLDANRVLVLMDGVNELPSEEARSQLAAFRRQYPRVPAIFTTRDLSLGGDVGIEKKLEMQPLTEAQMQEFVRAYLPECGKAMWQKLQGRLREFGKTPLLLWMLCEVVDQSPKAQLPSNLGGIFQVFARSYEVSSVRKHEVAALKGDVRPLSERRLWGKALKHLAEGMMCGEKPVDFRVVIERGEAERELEKLFEKEPSPPKIARDCLEDLLKYHLLQIKAGNEIEFRHQLIQEYYAAEALLARLPGLSDGELKREYLNYIKWTEPVALMLALVEEEAQAVRVVRLALEVDGMLGARLAGEVKREWQKKTVGMVRRLDVPLWLKFDLWEKTRSDFVVEGLVRAIEHKNFFVRGRAAEALGKLGSEAAIPGLLRALEDEDSSVRWRAAEGLGKLGSEKAIPGLLRLLEHENFSVRGSAAEGLGKLGSEKAIPGLLRLLADEDSSVRGRAAEALGKLGSEKAIPGLLRALEDKNSWVRQRAVEGLGKLGSEKAIPGLLRLLEDKNSWVRRRAVEALGNIKDDRAAHILPNLRELISTKSGRYALQALTAIQANCKFYNYDIFHSPPLPKPETEPLPGQTTNIFNIDTLTASNSPLNLGGTIGGNQTSTQNPKPEP